MTRDGRELWPLHMLQIYSPLLSIPYFEYLIGLEQSNSFRDELKREEAMVALRNTVIAVLVISFFTFVALFGRLPALRKTPIGLLQRILCLHIPSGFRRLDSNITGGRLNRSIAGLVDYLLYKKNPVVLVSSPLHPHPNLISSLTNNHPLR